MRFHLVKNVYEKNKDMLIILVNYFSGLELKLNKFCYELF